MPSAILPLRRPAQHRFPDRRQTKLPQGITANPRPTDLQPPVPLVHQHTGGEAGPRHPLSCGRCRHPIGLPNSGRAAPRSSPCAAMESAMASRKTRPDTTSRVCGPVPRPCTEPSGSAGRSRTSGTGCGMCRCGKTPTGTMRTTTGRSWPLPAAWLSMLCGSMGSGKIRSNYQCAGC